MCIPEALFHILIMHALISFPECKTRLMFQVLFSHIYLTVSIESEKFPGLGVIVCCLSFNWSFSINPEPDIWADVEISENGGRYNQLLPC